MKIILRNAAAIALSAAAVGCATATIALAPGAERVKLTNNAADVVSCKPVGNVRAHADSPLDSEASMATIRNQALGLGANTIFFTGYVSGSEEGVAYNCP